MANTKVIGDVIANGTISTVHLADDAITAAKLDSTATGITFADLTVDTDTLYVDAANNRVGIGTTTNISSPLTVQTDGSAGSISIIGRNNGASDEAIISFYEYDGTTRNSYIIKEGGDLAIATGTGGSPLERMRITSDGILKFTNIAQTRKLSLYEVANNNFQFYGLGIESNTLVYSVADIGDSHVFFAGSGTTTRNELMRIDGDGSVGIGTASPDYKLEIESTSDADLVSIKSTAIANNTQMRLGISGNDSVISGTGGSTGNLVFKTYGSERMRIDTSGNIKTGDDKKIMGTTFSDSFLSFSSNGNTILKANDDVVIGYSSSFYVKQGGNIGIGRTDPNARLDIKGAGTSTGLTFETSDASNNQTFYIMDGGRAGMQYYPFVIGADSSTTVSGLYNKLAVYNASTRVVSVNYQDGINTIMSHAGAPNYGLEALTIRGDYIAFYTDYDPSYYQGVERMRINSAGDMIIKDYGNIYASTNNSTVNSGIYFGGTDNTLRSYTNDTERMRIDSSGNVGIGTTSPAEKLTIDGTVSGAYVRISNAGSGDVSSGYMIYNGSNLDFNVYTNPTFGNTTLLTREALAIRAGGSERMRITSAGNVGIGTTSPIAQLDVAGNTNQHHSVSTTHNGGWKNIQNLGATGWLDQTYSAGRIKVFGFENSNVNVSYCEYYVIRSSAGYHIQQIGTRLDQGNTHGHVEVQVSGNFLQVRNVAQSSLGAARIVFSGMKD